MKEWTATPNLSVFEGGKLRVDVQYSNGVEDSPKTHRVNTYEELRSEVAAELTRLDGVTLAEAQVLLGTPIDTAPPPPSAPTSDQLKAIALQGIADSKRMADLVAYAVQSGDPVLEQLAATVNGK